CFLKRNASLAVVVGFKRRDHHAVSKRAVDDASIRRNRNRTSLTVLAPVIGISKLNVLAVVSRHAARRYIRPSTSIVGRTGAGSRIRSSWSRQCREAHFYVMKIR